MTSSSHPVRVVDLGSEGVDLGREGVDLGREGVDLERGREGVDPSGTAPSSNTSRIRSFTRRLDMLSRHLQKNDKK